MITILSSGGDDRIPIQSAINNEKDIYLPDKHYRISSSLARHPSATDGFRSGLHITGGGMLNTVLECDSGPAILLDSNGLPLKFSAGTRISDISIKGGIAMTCAWFVSLKQVWITNVRGDGISVPWRGDLNPNLSDPWQCFSIDIDQCWIRNCAGWGINFGGGQSPGLWSVRRSIIQINKTGGIRSTTGQFDLSYNLIGENPIGLQLDTKEGPQRVFEVKGNEFDTNARHLMIAPEAINGLFSRNRFLRGAPPQLSHPGCVFDKNMVVA